MYQDFYKESINRKERQEERRCQLLNEQKIRRLEQQDGQRKLSSARYNIKRLSLQEITKKYNLHTQEISLQLSEWMRERPENLNEWLFVPCPQGKRCMIVAEGGITLMFNKKGKLCSKFRSRFPGGGSNGRIRNLCTILDCVYSKQTNTFYILDVLCYGQQSMLNCETQFRYFWLRSQFEDNDNCFTKLSPHNERVFKLIDAFDMSHEVQIQEIMRSYPLWPNDTPKLDGFLFYHKEGSYICDTTPLVCWLFAFMVPEILEIDVNSEYKKPSNYINAWQYMDAFDIEMSLKCKQEKIRKCSPVTCAIDHIKLQDDCSILNNIVHNDKLKDEDECMSSLMTTIEAERKLELSNIGAYCHTEINIE